MRRVWAVLGAGFVVGLVGGVVIGGPIPILATGIIGALSAAGGLFALKMKW